MILVKQLGPNRVCGGTNPMGKKEETVMNQARDAYVQKLKAQIDEWNAEIDKLAAKADWAEVETKTRYHRHMEELQAKRKEVEGKIAAVQQAG
jgi:hypothetical protein